LHAARSPAIKTGVEKNHEKSVVRGLITAGVCLGFAAVMASGILFVAGWMQLPIFVLWAPVVLIAIFLLVVLALLRWDMAAQRRSHNRRP